MTDETAPEEVVPTLEAEEDLDAGTPAAGSRMQALVEYMARGIVDAPDAVAVTPVEGRASVIFELRVAPEDMGKIIGKDGRVAKAMRTLLKVTAAREHKRAMLEIV